MSMASERTTLLSGNDKSSKNCKGQVLLVYFVIEARGNCNILLATKQIVLYCKK